MVRHPFRIHQAHEMITLMIEPKIIKTEAQYRTYLAEVERLASEDPRLGTPDGDRLELLAKLVEDYEKERFKFERPDPIDAITFRMEEQGLRQKDIAPILGGKNRASEILSRKRPLTLSMVRALSESLNIPAELLVREPDSEPYEVDQDSAGISPSQFVNLGWFSKEEATRLTTSDLVRRYLSPTRGPLYLKHTITYGATPATNKTHLRLWVGKVRELANITRNDRGSWRTGTLNEQFLSYVARLSWAPNGPRMAKEFLAEKGIALVILRASPKTKLDGAAMLGEDGAPIIGLTIRHDRLDNFWFTLLHELAHVWRHIFNKDVAITDEDVQNEHNDDPKEAEANQIAKDAFISRSEWKRSEAFLRPSAETVYALADKLHISPAVIAGRLRRERVGYSMLSRLVGYKQVSKFFPELKKMK